MTCLQEPLRLACSNSFCQNPALVVSTREDLINNTVSRNRYIMMRHGYSERNPRNILAGRYPEQTKFHLLEQGIRDAQESAEKLKSEEVDIIITSPLVRAEETAHIVASAVGVMPILDSRLCDYDSGTFEGQEDSVLRTHPKYESIAKLFEINPPLGETYTQLRVRVMSLFKDCEKILANQTIVMVSHGDPLWIIDSAIRGLNIEETVQSRNAGEYIPTGTFQEIKYTEFPYNERGELDFSDTYLKQCKFICKHCATGNLVLY